MPGSLLLPCDVTKQEEVDETFKRVGEEFGRLDFLIHSIAYAPREALSGEYLDTSREAFLTALGDQRLLAGSTRARRDAIDD